MYVGAFLVAAATFSFDTSDVFAGAFDYQILGPFDASPGRPPTIPAIDLATSRFAVNHWEADEALRLGGDQTPTFLNGPITGVSTGTSSPTLFALTNGPQVVNQGMPNQTFTQVGQLAIWQNGSWRRVNGPARPFNYSFNDVAAFSATDVYIAGVDGLYHYDGTSISLVTAVNRDQLRSVAVSPSNVSGKFVVAGTSDGSVWVGNTTTFTKYSSVAGVAIDAVCINGATEAFALNRASGVLVRFDGTTVTAVQSPLQGAKTDLQCAGPGQAFVTVSSNPASVLRWNGQTWTTITGPPAVGGRSMNVAAVSANELYAVSDSGGATRVFYRYDGTSWREVGRLAVTGGLLAHPWADPRGGAAYVASTSSGTTRIESITPTAATVVSYQPSMRDVVMPTASSAFAVGANYFLARWNGARWSVDAPPTGTATSVTLQGVWSDSPSNTWVVGTQSTIARWDGTRWTVLSDGRRPIASPGDNYNAVWSSGGSVWIGGDASILRCTSTSTCAPEAVAGSGPIYGIWGTSTTNAFAVGPNGRVLRYDGKSWTTMAFPTTARLSRVWGSGPSDVWAVGDTTIAHYDGTAWKVMTQAVFGGNNNNAYFTLNPGGAFQMGMWGTGPKEVYVGTWYGRVQRGESTNWGEMASPSEPFNNGVGRIVGIGGTPGGCAIAVTDGQTGFGAPVLLRGVGPTGCLGSPMTAPATWP
jgi:hypothetical protein